MKAFLDGIRTPKPGGSFTKQFLITMGILAFGFALGVLQKWMDGSAEPAPGMIIFFDWDDENGQDGLSDHTGIVEKVENGRVYTIEGNSGDSVRQNSYPVGHYEVLGYGCPDF